MAKSYNWRRWQTLATGMLLSSGCGAVLILVVIPGLLRMDWKEHSVLANAFLMLFCAGIPILLFSCGLLVLWRWLKCKVDTLEISDAGVRYGARFDPWDQIKWISWRYIPKGGPTLFYQKGGFSFDRNLMVTDPLTEEEIMSLFRKLESQVVPLHRNLTIGVNRQPTLR